MSIHVCKCDHNGRTEYHLRYPGMTQEEAQRLADKINGGAWQSRTTLPPATLRDQASDAVKAAVLAEREACAKVCEGITERKEDALGDGYYFTAHFASLCAKAIRARGTATLPLLSDDEMPPLPEPVLEGVDYQKWGQNFSMDCYSADQLRARDRAVEAAVRKQMGVV